MDRLADTALGSKVLLLVKILLKLSNDFRVCSPCDGLGGPGLDGDPSIEDVPGLVCVGRRHKGTSLGEEDDEPFPGEPLQGCSHRAATDAEGFHKRKFRQLGPRQETLIDNGRKEVVVGVRNVPNLRAIAVVHDPDHSLFLHHRCPA